MSNKTLLCGLTLIYAAAVAFTLYWFHLHKENFAGEHLMIFCLVLVPAFVAGVSFVFSLIIE